jgi:hypothetical protein
LIREADKATAAAHGRMTGAIDELARARQELVELRMTALWAGLYPHETARRDPHVNLLAGGGRRPHEQAGLSQALAAERALQLLRDDGDWLRHASSAEQQAQLEGRDPKRKEGAMWGGTKPARHAERQDFEALVSQYVAEYGHEPDALQLAAYRDGIR